MSESFYRISAKDRIVEVGGHWDVFATENNAPGAMWKNICGRSIWDCISGLDTQSYLNAIFFWVRRQNTMFQTTYRCDSPDIARLFRMTIFPDAEVEGGLTVWHTEVWSQRLAAATTAIPQAAFKAAPRCSVCCRFQVGSDWVDPVFVPSSTYFPASYDLCPSCKAEVLRKLQTSGALGKNVLPFRRSQGDT